MAIELREHQVKALEQLKNGSILAGHVGSGKSMVALKYYTEKDQCGDLYIITTAKKRDSGEWESDAAKLGIGINEGRTLYGTITVDSWNNISKYEDREGCTFIFDEQRLVGKGAWTKSFLRIAKKNSWLLLSGTPGDTWSDYIPVFVANKFYKNRTDFTRQHIVYAPYVKFPKIERYVGIHKLEKCKEEIIVEMAYKKHTTRHIHWTDVDYDVDHFNWVVKNKWDPFKDAPIENIAQATSVLRRIVNSHPSRLEAIRELMEEHPRLIVFYNYDFELEILRTLNDTWSDLYEIGEWNGHKKEMVPEGENWVYLVQYTSGSEGWNCIATDAMAFYSLNHSYRKFEQAQGRIDRLTTLYNILSYFPLVSESPVDRGIVRALEKKENFNDVDLARRVFGKKDPFGEK